VNQAIVNAYAINIMPSQIAKHLRCLITDINAIEQERKNFREYLVSRLELGRYFFDQLEAWRVYSLNSRIESIFEESLTESISEEESSWKGDIENIIRSKLNPPNYNEFGGQE
jgi:hypothetical protein